MIRQFAIILLLSGILFSSNGCACARGVERPFVPARDGFAFANELRWTYHFTESEMTVQETEPAPQYSLRCFPMVRAAREFFYHARFEPGLPRATRAEYDRLVDQVTGRNSRCPAPESERVVIPGYDSLHAFSEAWPGLLKQHCGGALRSFFQRGNWRMVFPVTRGQQERLAGHILSELKAGRVPALHIYRFPNTSLNHALLAYAATEGEDAVIFSLYDPNNPSHTAQLTFDRRSRTFLFERNQYFGGGAVKVYEVYRGWFY